MNFPNVRQCGNCAYWHNVYKGPLGDQFQCRRRAPTSGSIGGGKFWPLTNREDWCAEWEGGTWNKPDAEVAK